MLPGCPEEYCGGMILTDPGKIMSQCTNFELDVLTDQPLLDMVWIEHAWKFWPLCPHRDQTKAKF